MEASPSPALDVKVRKETNRILNAQRRHFLSLSFLFLFPPSVAITVYPMLQSYFSDSVAVILFGQASDDHHHQLAKTLLLALAFLLFTSVFSLCAAGSITYSAINAFHGQPLGLKSAIKSIPTSFFRLLGTNLLVQTISLFIAFVFVTVLVTSIAIARLMGFHTEFSSSGLRLLCYVVVTALFLILSYVQVNWALSSVVAVAETTWGLASLKRSTSLVKGMRRGLVFRVSLTYGFYTTVMACALGFVSLSMGLDSATSEEWGWLIKFLSAQVLTFSTFRTIYLLFETVATAVLYMYCNEAVVDHGHGIKNFSVEYVTLAVDDDDEEEEKAPPVVSKLDGYNEV
ncbi:Transmembrane protein [Trema orientale]|uniref:Transmembrane protein n=1 Tax=Trema orientale TaxID=63057 RepID=A0A2P5G0A0_TREOI|nr:Transmembrane protein [Trema orientale]